MNKKNMVRVLLLCGFTVTVPMIFADNETSEPQEEVGQADEPAALAEGQMARASE